tara:strand:+ start:3468 stop:3710 length:243 start_codon:yes stop_codon:yes gene_type:complete
MGLLGNATAIPVVNVRDGAANAAAAICIHGTCPVSVYNIPEKPWLSTLLANSPAEPQVDEPVIKSNSTSVPLFLPYLSGN